MVLNGADRSNGASSVRWVGEAPSFGVAQPGDQVVDEHERHKLRQVPIDRPGVVRHQRTELTDLGQSQGTSVSPCAAGQWISRP
jgi:hypothetical protein